MARINSNSLLFRGLSGRVGNLVFRNTANGTILANMAMKSKRTSPAQNAVRNRFANAAVYAGEQIGGSVTQELYTSAVKRKRMSSYAIPVSDYLCKPSIDWVRMEKYKGAA